jgi:hypothetical protein
MASLVRETRGGPDVGYNKCHKTNRSLLRRQKELNRLLDFARNDGCLLDFFVY